MKKILALTLAVIMALMLVSCAGQNAKLSRGTIEGDVYKNEFLGFEFTKPSSWVYSSDEEIAELLDFTVDNLLGDKFEEALEKNPAVYDMMVVDSITRTNINVVYENLKKSLSTNITEKQYIEAVKKQLEGVSSMTVTFSDTLEKVKLGKTEFTKCVCVTKSGGVSMTQVYYLRKVGSYMASIVVTIPSGYSPSQIEAMFK